MTKKKEVKAVMIIKDIPAKLRQAFKVKCVSQGISMKDKIIEFMKKVVKS